MGVQRLSKETETLKSVLFKGRWVGEIMALVEPFDITTKYGTQRKQTAVLKRLISRREWLGNI
jgi:hypothetical protein